MVKSLSVRIRESLDVSGAFDNCFFHTYATHLIANDFPLPKDLFTFKSILGGDSYASNLHKRFPNFDSLSLFAKYAEYKNPEEEPISPNFIVEKTLVLGFMLREWFATKMSENLKIRDAIQNKVVGSFNNYIEFREAVSNEDLLSGPEGVLYTANQDFLEYCIARPKEGILTEQEKRFEKYFTDNENNTERALVAYWKGEGYQNYCRQFATPGTKLSQDDVTPMIQSLEEPVIIYNSGAGLIQKIDGDEAIPPMEVVLDVLAGHYHLLKTEETEALLEEYDTSFKQYKTDREKVLSTVGDKLEAANSKPSLLVGAICPSGLLEKTPFALLLDKVDDMQRFVVQHDLSIEQRRLEEQRKLEEEQRKQKEIEQRKLEEEQRKQKEVEQRKLEEERRKQKEVEQRKLEEERRKQKEVEQRELEEERRKQKEVEQRELEEERRKQKEVEQRKLEEERRKQKEIEQRKLEEEQRKQKEIEQRNKVPRQEQQKNKKEEMIKVSLQKVDKILEELESKIGKVDQHNFGKAHRVASKLLTELKEARNNYESNLKESQVTTEQAGAAFNVECGKAINKAKPVLERDLGWGDYLKNLMRTLANAVVWTVTLGNVNSFFPYARAASVKAVEQTEQDLLPKPVISPK
ncbi:TPA: hypothetical protein JAN90_01925 [Legionella pneumophila]|nr:hypothetical protein [Legionella pneumophila]HAT8866737.1 hypothetical protein [Legionella pneumophila subsp. pneumophila]HAT8888320.1 hypothetical protein [Legionella pneumophila subsp. pneumophila]HAT8931840.1 hypothetical protein [Legionella pneumophila subsp. pneumophila]HAU0160934.1 hypothetical protein [Legionella pneumophila]